MQLIRTIGSLVIVGAFVISPFAVPEANAQSRSHRDWRTYLENSSEGQSSDIDREAATSRRGVSSATQKKISALDDDPVEKMPIPVLFGVSLAQIYPDFGDDRDGGERSHEGQDILAPRGSYIVSPTDAVVTKVGTGSSAGKYVYTANPGGETFTYMHLDDFADGLKAGDVLEPGDLIGYVGDTGNAKGGVTHVHFEIRENRKATDPYPRLKGEFSLKERMEAVTQILKESDDEEDDAEALVATYRGLFVAASAQGIELPKSVTKALGSVIGSTVAGVARDLTLGSQGQDVIALQAFLITQAKGPSATTLASAGATGYFGAMTQAALAEYQKASGISPASGYFGPLTRASMGQ